MWSRYLPRFVPLILVVLLLAACNGSSDEAADTTVATTTTAAPTTTEPSTSVEAPELADTSWNVIAYRLPDGSITNVIARDVTISFSADGHVSGSAGCNSYNSFGGRWRVG